MPWCFAIVNGKLAEIYFDETKKGPKNIGHCYVKKEEYKIKREPKYINAVTERNSV